MIKAARGAPFRAMGVFSIIIVAMWAKGEIPFRNVFAPHTWI
jgi:hypothetical protein